MSTSTRQNGPLPMISGLAFPRVHPGWCDVAAHRLEWTDVLEFGGEAPPCHREVAGGFLPALHRCAEPTPATRADQGTWVVAVEQVDRAEYVDDAVVTIERGMSGEVLLRLTAGEARDVAAALLRGADHVLFRDAR